MEIMKYIILPTENTHRIAEEIQRNIAGLEFIPRVDLGDKWRGVIMFPDMPRSPFTLLKSDLERLEDE
jgi:hypothetical protein